MSSAKVSVTPVNQVEIDENNIDNDILQIAKILVQKKMLIIQEPKKSKASAAMAAKANCPCAISLTFKQASTAVSNNRDVYVIEDEEKEYAYTNCTRPVYTDKKTKVTSDYCFKHTETSEKNPETLRIFADIVSEGNKVTINDPFFTVKKQKKIEKEAKAKAKRAVKEAIKNYNIRIPITNDMYQVLMKMKDNLELEVGYDSSPNMEDNIITIKKKSPSIQEPESAIDAADDNEDDEDAADDDEPSADAATRADAEDTADEIENDNESLVEMTEVDTITGEKLCIFESGGLVYRVINDEPREIGSLVLVEQSLDKYAFIYEDNKYIVGVPFEYLHENYYYCAVTYYIFNQKNPAKLVGMMKKSGKTLTPEFYKSVAKPVASAVKPVASAVKPAASAVKPASKK